MGRINFKKIWTLSLFILVFFVFPDGVSAATYYVDSDAGSDSNDGLSQGAPFETVKKASALSLSPGDSVLLKYGSEFREGLFDNGEGTAENRITWGAYGDSEDGLPIINAAQLLNNSSVWSNYSGDTWKASHNYGSEFVSNGGFESWTGGLPDDWTDPGASITVEDETSEVHSDSHAAKLTANTDSAILRQTASGFEPMTYYLAESWYKTTAGSRVRLYVNGSGATDFTFYTEYGDWTKEMVLFRTGHEASTVQIWAWMESSGDVAYVDDVSIKKASGCNSEVVRLFLDREGQGQAVDASSVNSTDTWYYDETEWDLYVYSPGGNPATAYSSPGVEILSYHNTAVDLNSYTNFQNIHVIGGRDIAFALSFNSYMIVENSVFDYMGKYGIYHSAYNDTQKAEYNIIRNNVIDRKWTLAENPDSGEPGFDGVSLFNSAENNTISGNTIRGFGHDGIGFYGTQLSMDGINSNIIEYNDISAPISIYMKPFSIVGYEDKASNNIVRYNFFHDYKGPAQIASNGNQIYNNIFSVNDSENGANFAPGFSVYSVNNYRSKDSQIYNNSFYGMYDAGIELDAWSYPIDDITMKNNLFSNNDTSGSGWQLYFNEDSTTISGTVFQNNNVYDSGTVATIKESGAAKTVSEAEAAWSGFSSNVSSDPLLSNIGGSYALATDFTLQSLSPAIDAGTDVSLTTDYAGSPIYGLPDIGAYEYQPPYTMGTHEIDTSADVRVYGDGKFRNTVVTGGTTADLSVDPASDDKSQYLDIEITTWETSGDYSKEWTEDSTTITGNTAHIVGDLEANKYYNVSVDSTLGQDITGGNCTAGVCLSNSSGEIEFTYSGGYSTHTFLVEESDNTAPTITS
ncbi:right-handed parallel beta-helix repeat-containing protein, partial [Patescibacteria group bacterium]